MYNNIAPASGVASDCFRNGKEQEVYHEPSVTLAKENDIRSRDIDLDVWDPRPPSGPGWGKEPRI